MALNAHDAERGRASPPARRAPGERSLAGPRR